MNIATMVIDVLKNKHFFNKQIEMVFLYTHLANQRIVD